MSIYSIVTEQDLIILLKLAEQQKTQGAPETKKKLKQTQFKKLAEKLSPIAKKLHKVKESSKKLDEIVK